MCGGERSGGAVCLSGHAQFHYVHTWGFVPVCVCMCACSNIYCEGVKDF